MARITITMPDTLHTQVLKLAQKDKTSISYTVSKLVEFGLLIANSKEKEKQEQAPSPLDEHCKKLVIQINGILKELAINHYKMPAEQIAKITRETTEKYNELLK